MSGAWRTFCGWAATVLKPLAKPPIAAGNGVLWLVEWFEAQATSCPPTKERDERRELRS